MGQGVAYETPPQLVNGLWIDGAFFVDSTVMPIPGWDYSTGGTLIRNIAGGTLTQLRFLAGNAPMALNPMKFSLTYTVSSLAEQRAIQEKAAWGLPIPIYFDIEMQDVWYIAGAAAGQTLWKTSRRFPYGIVPNITHATRAPAVLIDDVAQTIVEGTSATNVLPPDETPAAGQAVVPSYQPDSGVNGIKLPAGITGTRLVLRYHPLFLGIIQNVAFQYPIHNGLVFSATVAEHLPGIYA